ncbi:MAG: hypothetical protein KJ950_09680 [Proteobacteria bacterium]|nr:hypothetical protein [Pseudomonadota bacterium]MBU1688924.1 hypothetical protein [Pseudomonadota bacterium]
MHRRAFHKSDSGFGREPNHDKDDSEYLPGLVLLNPLACSGFVLIVIATILFMTRNDGCPFWFVLAVLPFILLQTFVLAIAERNADRLQFRLVKRFGRLHSVFLLFFVYLLGFLLLLSLVVAFPAGLILTRLAEGEILRLAYGRWIVNLAIFMALTGWLRYAVMRLLLS